MPTNEELAAIAVGDTVMVNTGYKGAVREAVVTKIGRTLIHTRDGIYYRDGQRRRDGYPGQYWTKAQYADLSRRDDAIARMRAVGFDPRSGSDLRQWSTDQLAAMAGFAEHVKGMDQGELARPVFPYDIADIAAPRDIDLYCQACWLGECQQHEIPMNVKVRQLLSDYAWLSQRFEALQRGIKLD